MLFIRAPWIDRIRWLAVATAAAVIVIAPWVTYNLHRFDERVLISSQGGQTLAASNCDLTYYGPLLGFKDLETRACNRRRGDPRQGCEFLSDRRRAVRACTDASWFDHELRQRASQYIRAHHARVPIVVLAREGRAWGFFRPLQQARLELIRDEHVVSPGSNTACTWRCFLSSRRRCHPSPTKSSSLAARRSDPHVGDRRRKHVRRHSLPRVRRRRHRAVGFRSESAVVASMLKCTRSADDVIVEEARVGEQSQLDFARACSFLFSAAIVMFGGMANAQRGTRPSSTCPSCCRCTTSRVTS